MFLSASHTNYDHLMIFRSFVKKHGKVKLRRVLHTLDHNHSAYAIAEQLALPIGDVKDIVLVHRRSA